MATQQELEQLESLRPRGLSRLLLLARRNFVMEIARLIQETGQALVPDSCLMLLPHIDIGGTRSTDIARRAGMTKQAVTQVIQQMEKAGLVQKKADPADARAILISFTEFGIGYLRDMHAVIDRVELDLSKQLGQEQMKQLRSTLDFMAYDWPSMSK